MKLDKIFQILVPKDKKFYPLFKEASTNVVAAAVLLTEMVRNVHNSERAEYVSKIKEKEHLGDNYTKTLLKELNKTFITPFDREDILELANRLDGVVDLINTTAKRIVLYNLTEIPLEFIEMAETLNKIWIAVEKGGKFVRNKNLKKFECPICLEVVNQDTIKITHCGHIYCIDCLVQVKETMKKCSLCLKML